MKRAMCILAPLALILIMALSACSSSPSTATPPAATAAPGAPTAAAPAASPAAQGTPKYGGTLNLALNTDVTTFDDFNQGGPGVTYWNQGQQLMGGDWAKGNAGGYGTKQTDWGTAMSDLITLKTGYLAESWKITTDAAKGTGTIVFNIRPNVHYALNPKSPASAAVGGRTVTAEDVLAALNQSATDKRAWDYRNYPQLRSNIHASITGPMQVSVTTPLSTFINAIHGLGATMRIYPTELTKFDTTKWQNQVGTGPFMLTNYVQGSSLTLVKNPKYWGKDPVGPGKGNQLPYLDGVQLLIVQDASTRLTAFRTGKIDQIAGLTWEDAAQVQKEFPKMPTALGDYYPDGPMYIRTDKKPYNDVRVRQALIMGTDFNSIKKDINGGNGIVISYPYEYYKDNADLYVGVDDKDLSPMLKQMYTYNPDGAKKLLAEAGYPNGFKSSIMMTAADSSYYEAIASMWAKIGVTLALDVKDPVALVNNVNTHAYNDLVASPGKGPATDWYVGSTLMGTPGFANPSYVDDKVINDNFGKIRELAITDPTASMKLARTVDMHTLEQAYAIPRPTYRTSTFWWPWLKNYSGEISVGFIYGTNWADWVWIDQPLKKSMGH